MPAPGPVAGVEAAPGNPYADFLDGETCLSRERPMAYRSMQKGSLGDGLAWRERMGAQLADSHLLTALVDPEGDFLFCNPALRSHAEAMDLPVGSFFDLFTPWSQDKLRDAALPAARQWGLWEGGLSLAGSPHRTTVRATLVGGSADPDGEGAVLALLAPHFGPGTGEGGSAPETPDLYDYLAIPLHQETRLLAPADITHLEAHGAYTQIFLTHQALLTSLRLSWLEASLPDVFVRTHRGYLVNMRRVDALVRQDGHLFMRLDSPACPKVPVSRRRESHVRSILETAHQVRTTTG